MCRCLINSNRIITLKQRSWLQIACRMVALIVQIHGTPSQITQLVEHAINLSPLYRCMDTFRENDEIVNVIAVIPNNSIESLLERISIWIAPNKFEMESDVLIITNKLVISEISKRIRSVGITQRCTRLIRKGIHGVQRLVKSRSGSNSNSTLFHYYEQYAIKEDLVMKQVIGYMDDFHCPTTCISNHTSDQSISDQV